MPGKQMTMFRHIMSETYRVLLVSHESCSPAFSLLLPHPHLVVDTEINIMAVIVKLRTHQMPATDPFIYSTFISHGFLVHLLSFVGVCYTFILLGTSGFFNDITTSHNFHSKSTCAYITNR